MNTVLEQEEEKEMKHCTATRNACKLCTPLGACLAFRGVEGCIPFLHGSQGCATYIRRYLISHFREPMDVASSNFHEESAIFGGGKNLKAGLANVSAQYEPEMIGLATTCLAETIGENVPLILKEYRDNCAVEDAPPIVSVSTPSYRGTHMDGFHETVRALVGHFAESGRRQERVAIFPGMVSAEDLRHLKEICREFGLPATLLPDYSETMDGETWDSYQKMPSGGTPIHEIVGLGSVRMSIEFGRSLVGRDSAGAFLEKQFQVPRRLLGLPIGIRETDRFMEVLETATGRCKPAALRQQRGRLVDALIDGHKYVFGKRAIVCGDADLATGLAAFLSETGIFPVLCATGERRVGWEKQVREAAPDLPPESQVCDRLDFAEIEERAEELKPDIVIGSSKGYRLARKMGVPLIRVGFPIHDRIGGQRVLHLGYAGAQQLYDRTVNALMEKKQTDSTVGYSYL